MGCFTGLKTRKKLRAQQSVTAKTINLYDNKPGILPEPGQREGDRVRASPNLRSKLKTIHHANWLITNRPRRPLPLPRDGLESGSSRPILKASSTASGVAEISFSEPNPRPPPKDSLCCLSGLQYFTYEELSAACNCFCPDRCLSEGPAGSVYRASLKDGTICGGGEFEATIMRFFNTAQQPYKEFVMDVDTIASLQHPRLCNLIGFHARENGERLLVYERLFHGSLDRLLYGLSPPIDWCTRMRIALGAAQGLAYLHEEGPFLAMYSEFRAANVQIDRDFSAKLSDYGFAVCKLEAEMQCNSSTTKAYIAPETLVRGLLTPKSNVWSFGIMLLELLTGRQNMGCLYPKEERNLVKWTMPFLRDESRLLSIMDPKLNMAGFSIRGAKTAADLALRCLQMEPSDRPTMSAAFETLKTVQDMKHSLKYPRRAPAIATTTTASNYCAKSRLNPGERLHSLGF